MTCASLGNVRALLYAGGPGAWQEALELSADHRLGSCAAERDRLRVAGVALAALDASGSGPAPVPARGTGSLRMWPGGLAFARVSRPPPRAAAKRGFVCVLA